MFLSWSTRISLTMERHNSRFSGIDKESYTLSKSIFKKFFKYDKSLTGRESSAFIFSSCISNFSLSSLNSSIVMRSFKYRSFNFCIFISYFYFLFCGFTYIFCMFLKRIKQCHITKHHKSKKQNHCSS